MYTGRPFVCGIIFFPYSIHILHLFTSFFLAKYIFHPNGYTLWALYGGICSAPLPCFMLCLLFNLFKNAVAPALQSQSVLPKWRIILRQGLLMDGHIYLSLPYLNLLSLLSFISVCPRYFPENFYTK